MKRLAKSFAPLRVRPQLQALTASFEEQASVLQSSVGGPWMLRNEARARMNLPALPGADELIVPLNVTEGGLASPNDTDPTKAFPLGNRMSLPPEVAEAFAKSLAEALAKALPQAQATMAPPQPPQARALTEGEGRQSLPFALDGRELRVSVKARPEAERGIADVLRRFYERQREGYIGGLVNLDLDAADVAAALERVYEAKRGLWLADAIRDLMGCVEAQATDAASRTLELLGADAGSLDAGPLGGLARDMCVGRAGGIAASVRDQLVAAFADAGPLTPRAVRRTVYGALSDEAIALGADGHARSMATGVVNGAMCEGARQSGADVEKEWVCTGHHSRDEHARLGGRRVPLGELFPIEGGAMWPGDPSLSAGNTCNCHCRIDIVRGGKAQFRGRRTREVAEELGLEGYEEAKLDTAILRCQQTVDCGGRLWEELTPGEKVQVLDELRTRDRDWVAFGRDAVISYENPCMNDDERHAYEVLSRNGFSGEVREVLDEDRERGYTSPDFRIDGVRWELKCPIGSNRKKTIPRNVNKALEQLRNANPPAERMNVIVSALETGLTDAEVERSVLQIMSNGNVDEMLVIYSKTYVRRYTRQ